MGGRVQWYISHQIFRLNSVSSFEQCQISTFLHISYEACPIKKTPLLPYLPLRKWLLEFVFNLLSSGSIVCLFSIFFQVAPFFVCFQSSFKWLHSSDFSTWKLWHAAKKCIRSEWTWFLLQACSKPRFQTHTHRSSLQKRTQIISKNNL